MFLATERYCLDSSEVWNSRPIFADLFSTFRDRLGALGEEVQRQGETSVGVTRNKKEPREPITEGVMPVVDALLLHAALTDEAALREDAAFTETDLLHRHRPECRGRPGLGQCPLTDVLANYALAPEDPSGLRATIDEYRGTLTTQEILRLMEKID